MDLGAEAWMVTKAAWQTWGMITPGRQKNKCKDIEKEFHGGQGPKIHNCS